MQQLTVSVSGKMENEGFLTLPFAVFAPDGRWLAEGTASPRRSALLVLPNFGSLPERVYVLAKLPNGEQIQQATELQGGVGNITLLADRRCPHKWLQWAMPFRSLMHLEAQSYNHASREISTRQIGHVWMTLWAMKNGRWVAIDFAPTQQQRDAGIQQFWINTSEEPHLLQIGGEAVAWRLVSLPPRSTVRVALTRSDQNKGDTLDITVGRQNSEHELIMSYLSRGALAEASRLAKAWEDEDLEMHDPVSAVACAYLLFKQKRLEERRPWLDRLVEHFPYIADGAIISAALALQRDNISETDIPAKIALALSRGFPIFSMGASLLVETMAAIHRGEHETKKFHQSYLAAQAYARACCTKGAYFAFYGKSPAQPSWMPIYGRQDSPVEDMVDQKPIGSIQRKELTGITLSVKFGNTTVALPRPPIVHVMADLQKHYANSGFASGPSKALEPPFSLFPTTLPAVRMKNQAISPATKLGTGRGLRPVDAETSSYANLEISALLNPAKLAEPPPRQTQKYWQEGRTTHAITVFGANEE